MAISKGDHIIKALSNSFKKYNLGRTNALTRVALEIAYSQGDLWLKDVLKTIEKKCSYN